MKTPPIDPLNVFVNAIAYREASIALHNHTNHELFFWPAVALEAFALELFIKCLHHIRGRQFKGHDVQQLFGELDEADRQQIEAVFNELVQNHRQYAEFVSLGAQFDIDSVLVRSKTTFVNVRYAHENKPPAADDSGNFGNYGAGSLCDAIRLFIESIRSEWDSIETRNLHVRPSTDRTP